MAELISYSPITLKEVGRVKTSSSEDVLDAVKRSRDAQKIWSKYPKKEKAAMLKKLRLTITENAELIAKTVYLETGKPKADAFNTEVMTSAMMTKECEHWVVDFKYVKKVDQGSAKLLTTFLRRTSYIEYRPLGVIAVISPYNFPFSIPFTDIVAAVAAGNGVVLKPSSDTPMSGHLIEKMFQEAGFPEGLVKAVSGPGTGSALTSADVDKIVFTGSTSTGSDIMSTAAKNLIPVTLELGGKDAMIVFDDADMDRTVAGAVWGSFVNSGQVCVGVKRIYVQNAVYEEFVSRFVSSVKELKQGDGWDDTNVSIGPMINQAQLDLIAKICKKAEEQGGTVLTGGKRNPSLSGYFFEPTVITDLEHSSDIVSEEIFGPVVTVFRFNNEDEALKMSGSAFGLGGSVWTKDIEKGRRVASQMDTGTVDINNVAYTFGLPATPWGGRNKSGFGTTHGTIGFENMMFPYHVHVDKGKYPRDPWWMPYNEEKTELQKEMTESFFGNGKGKISVVRKIFKVLKNKK